MSRARILADYVSSGDELADKAPLASPDFTGLVTAPVIKLTPTGTAPTGGNAVEGAIYYDSTSESVKVRSSSEWKPIGRKTYVTATGGDVTPVESGDYKYHVFTASKSGDTDGFYVTAFGDGSDTIEYLVVAGGGAGVPYAGSHGTGGGGGAGGYRSGTGLSVSAQNYDITIGAGGTAAQSSATGESGDPSIIEGLITATGGGGAGRSLTGTVAEMSGSVGGSGGGASGTGVASLGGVGIYDAGQTLGHVLHQGRDGGNVYPSGYHYGNGGGGGATTEGADGTSSSGGNGGTGSNALSAWVTAITAAGGGTYGVSGYFAGGGGGGLYSSGTYGGGGSGGGGAASASNATNGTGNTGGGGGGQGTGSGGNAGSGGSGIVIIRYKFQN